MGAKYLFCQLFLSKLKKKKKVFSDSFSCPFMVVIFASEERNEIFLVRKLFGCIPLGKKGHIIISSKR